MRARAAAAAAALLSAAPGGAQVPLPCKDLRGLATDRHDLSIWADVMGVLPVGSLDGPGPFTVFVPDDLAWERRPGRLAELRKPENRQELQQLLSYHIAGAVKLGSGDLTSGQVLTTMHGRGVEISKSGGQMRVNGILVKEPDVMACNGVYHVIDSVLTLPKYSSPAAPTPIPPAVPPPPPNSAATTPVPGGPCIDILPLAKSNTILSTLARAIPALPVGTLVGPGPFTVFAPTDAAWERLPKGTVEYLFKPENRKQLVYLLTYHLVGALGLRTDDLSDSQEVHMMNGLDTRVRKWPNGHVQVNNANIVQPNIAACNGVMHVIDQVLDMPTFTPVPPQAWTPPTPTPHPVGPNVFPSVWPSPILPGEPIRPPAGTPRPWAPGPQWLVRPGACYHVMELAQNLPTARAGAVNPDHALSAFLSAVMDAGLYGAFNADGPLTVFAPSDQAFQNFQGQYQPGDLEGVMRNHIVSGVTMSRGMTDGMRLRTMSGRQIPVSVDGSEIRVGNNRALVVVPDVTACNGVVHIIDAVIGAATVIPTPAPAPRPYPVVPRPVATPVPWVPRPVPVLPPPRVPYPVPVPVPRPVPVPVPVPIRVPASTPWPTPFPTMPRVPVVPVPQLLPVPQANLPPTASVAESVITVPAAGRPFSRPGVLLGVSAPEAGQVVTASCQAQQPALFSAAPYLTLSAGQGMLSLTAASTGESSVLCTLADNGSPRMTNVVRFLVRVAGTPPTALNSVAAFPVAIFTPSPTDGDDSSLDDAAIIGIIVGAVLLCTLCVILALLLLCRNKKKEDRGAAAATPRPAPPPSQRSHGYSQWKSPSQEPSSYPQRSVSFAPAPVMVPASGSGYSSRGVSTASGPVWGSGQTVRAQYIDGSWYDATVLQRDVDGSYTLQWYDGSQSHSVPAEQITPAA